MAPDFDDEVVAGACLTHDGAVRHARHRGSYGGAQLMDAVTLLTVVVLAVFVGFEVVSKVTSKLHTPLMSGANAIHGIILVGAVIVAGQAGAIRGCSPSRCSLWSSRPSTWSAASSSPTGCWRCSAPGSPSRPAPGPATPP